LVPANDPTNRQGCEDTVSGSSAYAASFNGLKLANQGEDTRSLAHYLGHRNFRYTALAPNRFAYIGLLATFATDHIDAKPQPIALRNVGTCDHSCDF